MLFRAVCFVNDKKKLWAEVSSLKNDLIFFYFLVLQLFPSSLVALRYKTEHWPKYLQVGQMQ